MKLKYRILEKLHNVSNSEMDLLVWAVQHSDEESGTMVWGILQRLLR